MEQFLALAGRTIYWRLVADGCGRRVISDLGSFTVRDEADAGPDGGGDAGGTQDDAGPNGLQDASVRGAGAGNGCACRAVPPDRATALPLVMVVLLVPIAASRMRGSV